MTKVKLGRYQHYKGHFYDVLGIAHFHENLEEMVLYKQLEDMPDYPKGTIWVRPKKMFVESVEVNGKKVPRFKYVGSKLL